MNPELNIHEINTTNIFHGLIHDKRWVKFGRAFVLEIGEELKSALINKRIVSVSYDGKNGDYLENYEKERYPFDLERAKLPESFPFPDYFLYPITQNEDAKTRKIYLDLVSYSEPSKIEMNETKFDFFFALQFSVTDLMEGDAFLQYQLDNNFESDFTAFKNFVEVLCIKHESLLKGQYEGLIKRFIANNSSNEKEALSFKGNSKDFTTARQVLAVHYLMEELSVFGKADKTEVARFIQFLTSKETGVAKIADTTIYRKVKSPFSKGDKELESDLQYVRGYFEKLGLNNIVLKITEEISKKEI